MKFSFKSRPIVGVLCAGLFLYGVAVGRYEVFPFDLLKALQDKFDIEETGPEIIGTNFVDLQKSRYNLDNPINLQGDGGGLTLLDDILLGVDRVGQFYLYRGSGQIQLLNMDLHTNLDEFLSFIGEHIEEDGTRDFLTNRFRVFDVLANIGGSQTTLYVTHNFWNDIENCMSLNVSRLTVENPGSLFAGDFSVGAEDWSTIFESRPCLADLKKLHGGRSGGRMVLDETNKLIVSVGDFGYDGGSVPNYPQDDDVSYGKIIGIDLDSLEQRIISKGHRNPQGLRIDSDGIIWETEHGPTGGDELNIIRQDSNYGWPDVTYGKTGPASIPDTERRRHLGFQSPVHSWVPSLGISNLLQVKHRPREWENDLLVSTLKTAKIIRLRIQEGRVIFGESIAVGNRVRDIEQRNDGTIVLWTDSAELIELIDILPENPDAAEQLALVEPELSPEAKEAIQSCRECHELSPKFSTANGPPLWNVYNRAIASTAYNSYSDALGSTKRYWDEASLRAYLTDPNEFARGTTMPNPFIGSASTLDEVISYLKRLN